MGESIVECVKMNNLRRVRGSRAILVLLVACNADTGGPAGVPSITITQGQDQQATVATMVSVAPTIVVRDGSGNPVAGTRVRFTPDVGSGWVVTDSVNTDAQGRATTTWYLGPRPGAHRLTAAASGVTVDIRATATALVPGQTYLGAAGYVELIAGDLPLVVSAPHGGSMTPTTIPDRTVGTFDRDTNTEELARAIHAAFQARDGRAPFIIICRLHRRKLDANREIVEAAQGNALAERAWQEYHGFIEAARWRVLDSYTRGFYIDLHGHGHAIARLELGYLLTANELAGDDNSLNGAALVQQSSIRTLVQTSARPHAELLRGPKSLGALFQAQGIRAVPSPTEPHPAGEPYFSGGYNTERYGSRNGSAVSGVQIESHFTGLRDNATNRTRFAEALVSVLNEYFTTYYGGPLVPATANFAAAIQTGRIELRPASELTVAR